jgi:hypothetical protein
VPQIPKDCKFTVKNSLGRVVPLVSGGESAVVTDANAREYLDLALSYRLKEFDRYVRTNAAAVRM